MAIQQSDSSLDVWLYGRRIARLTEPSAYRYRIDFTEEALDVHGEGARVLSLALPVGTQPVSDPPRGRHRVVSAFLEGLLPEGNLRTHVASTLGVLGIDKMPLLAKLGAECAGAVQFLPSGDRHDAGTVRPLSRIELDRLIADLPKYHLPDGVEPQASLAGVQDKVLLTRLSGGRWGWPEGGAVSTHLIKPEPLGASALPHLIQTENWALAVAGHAGLASATSHLEVFEGRSAIVVERYDRSPGGTRTHQEDFAQALGLDPAAKYESTAEYDRSGSRLSRLVGLAADRAMEPARFRTDLLAAVAFNVAIGNGDAHSKNYSILLGERGEVSLAPLYDIAPVMHISPKYKGTGHVIAGRTNIDWVSVADLVAEGIAWGISRRRADAAVRDTMERVRTAVESVTLPDGAGAVYANLDALWRRRSWPVAATSPRAGEATADDASPASGADAQAQPARVWVDAYVNQRGATVPGHWRNRPKRR